MKHYVGIDLGTTNSAICSFDGENLRLWKSPEQNDATPSAIYIDRRGFKYVGKRAYDAAPRNEGSSALLFKRLMGTGTPVSLPAASMTLTPEQCSAEVLKALYGYLPEEVRQAEETGTVITVPAAFDHMQKDATLQAAEMAGLGKVALMQEPVAAVMSVMRGRKADGVFIVYDFGGGTLDVAVSESIKGRVSLLAHGGIAMCGGRDFDRVLVREIVAPWLRDNFDLPEDFLDAKEWRGLVRLAEWATELAKIELSSKTETLVNLDDVRIVDRAGTDIYFQVPLRRDDLDRLSKPKLLESIQAVQETLKKAGYRPVDVERIVFVGGPTQYKPLRDLVTTSLGIPGSTEVNPMTAVAEGAAVFGESIDWRSASRGRKSAAGSLAGTGPLDVSFTFNARTTDPRARVVAKLGGTAAPGAEFQIDSLDTGWTSGRITLANGATVELQLPKQGQHQFKVFVFDRSGAPILLAANRIAITRTAATVDAIPASHNIGVEVLQKLGGRPTLDWLVRAGEPLPKRGKKVFKSAESLRAGSTNSLNFKLWEGEVEDLAHENHLIGVLKITGSDFDDGVIAAGADLVCEYEVGDSGVGTLEISVPSIGATFRSGRNFYSRQEGQIDFTAAAAHVAKEGARTRHALNELAERIDDPKLTAAKEKLAAARSLKPDETNAESTKQAMNDVLEARRLLGQVRKDHAKQIRQMELDQLQGIFEKLVQHARPSETTAIKNLFITAQRALERNDHEFENVLDEVRRRGFEILWRQDWFVVGRFKSMVESPESFADRRRFQDLAAMGLQALEADDISRLREVVRSLVLIQIAEAPDEQGVDVANILRA